MSLYNAIAGQSVYDVCLITYGSLDYLTKIMKDNGIDDIEAHLTVGQAIYYDDKLCKYLNTTNNFKNNNIGIATAYNIQTSYKNKGGSGDRSSLITVTQYGEVFDHYDSSVLVNGLYRAEGGYMDGHAANCWMKFDFATKKVIQEATLWQDITGTQGTWQWQGSNDNLEWTNIGLNFVFGVTDPEVYNFGIKQVQTELNINLTEYRYYRCLGISGIGSGGPYLMEMEFKIS